MVLKSEGFKDYKSLSQLVNESFLRVSDILKLADKDDTFSITVRDLKRIGKCCNSILESLVLKESKKQTLIVDHALKKKNKLMIYSMEKKLKSSLIKEMEEEDERD
jgi:hypothetical protein